MKKGKTPGDQASSSSPAQATQNAEKLIGDEPLAGAGGQQDTAPFSLRKTGHDLRNALNVIRNASYLLRRKLVAAGGENVDLVDMIEESVKSAEAVATQIMEHAIRTGELPTSRSTFKTQ